MNDLVPQRTLTKQGVAAVGGLAGGIGLLVLGALPSVFGIAAGAVVALIGLAAATSKEASEKRSGFIVAAAGALALLSKIPFLSGLAGPLLGLATIGLFGMGLWNGIKFFKGLKSRS